MQQAKLNSLTPQEQVVLSLLAEGKLYREIADDLYIAISTVDAHARNIYRKLGVSNRTQAAVLATRAKLEK